MYNEISAALSSAKIAFEIAKAANGLSNYNELVTAVSEVNAKLMQASVVALASLEKQSSLTSEITELKEKLGKIEHWESQMKRYRLHEFPTKALAYALQPGMEHGEPIHYLCTSCADKRQKSMLQPHGVYLKCQVCKIDIQTNPHQNLSFSHETSWKTV